MLVTYVLLAALACYYYLRSRRKTALPPGLKHLPTPPGGLPYLGNIHQLGSEPHKTFTKWGKELGDIYMVNMGAKQWIILNSDKVIADLLCKRGAIYSSRAPNFYLQDIIGRSRNYIISPYNDWYRKVNRIVRGVLSLSKITSYAGLIDKTSRETVRQIFRDSQGKEISPQIYFKQATLNIILTIVFATTTKDINDPFFKRIEKIISDYMKFISMTSRKADFFPILTWLPQHKEFQEAVRIRGELEDITERLLLDVQNDKEEKPSVARDLLSAKVKEGLDDIDMMKIFESFFIAGADSVASGLTWLTAVLANYPHIQEEAHAELDRVVGRTRLPVADDEPNLHYIRALIKESERCYPAALFGASHFIEQDDQYEGYHIPANTAVILNIYGIHYDERRYKDPFVFEPKRFLNVVQSSASLANGEQKKRDHFAFGAGRRLCAGIHLAETELQMIISQLLWCFRIENASPLGEDGRPVPIDLSKAPSGLTRWPYPYKIKFTPRHEGVSEVLFG